jgi:hypothetical protein
MRKSDLVEGQQYFVSSYRDWQDYGGSTVELVSNKLYTERSCWSVGDRYMADRSPRFRTAHLKYCQLEAWPQEFSPREKHDITQAYKNEKRAGFDRMLTKNPMFAFRESSTGDGVLVRATIRRYVGSELQEYVGLKLVPRRKFRCTATEKAQLDQEREQRARAAEADAIARQRLQEASIRRLAEKLEQVVGYEAETSKTLTLSGERGRITLTSDGLPTIYLRPNSTEVRIGLDELTRLLNRVASRAGLAVAGAIREVN